MQSHLASPAQITAAAPRVVQQMLPRQITTDLPVFLWRLGFGPLIGQLFMLITATGRRSGLPRRAFAGYFFVNGRKYVYGDREAQWYQNLLADPHATLQTAFGTERVTARHVTEENELVEVFAALMHNRPATAQQIFSELGVQAFPDDLIANRERLRLLAFDPTDAPTPPPLEADLRWMLPIVLAGMLVGWRLARRKR